MTTQFITDIQLYEKIIQHHVPQAKNFLWIATADVKDLHVHYQKRMIPFLQVLSDLIGNGVLVRLIHAKEPGPAFRKDFDRFPNLIQGLERMLCPRVHFKSIIVDGNFAYSGSANLTGAGLGSKSQNRRNFESGWITKDPFFVEQIMDQFDQLWLGSHCPNCGRRDLCPEPIA